MRKTAAALATAITALGVAGCGGSSSTSSTPTSSSSSTSTPAPTSSASSGSAGQSAGTSSIAADSTGQLKFTKSSLSAKAGKVTIRFINDAPLSHNLTIQQGASGPVIGATPSFQGGVKTLTVNLKPGTYTFFCSVPGHRQAGMQGTLTVR